MAKIKLTVTIDDKNHVKYRERISGKKPGQDVIDVKITNALAIALGVRCAKDSDCEECAMELLDDAYALSEATLQKYMKVKKVLQGKEK